jgi:hypothetical protein
MPGISLTGLIGSRPLGALAAFGFLRIVSRLEQFRNPRLSWRFTDDWIAVFHVDSHQNETNLRSTLIDALVERQKGRAQEEYLTLNDDIKIAPGKWAMLLKAKAGECRSNSRETVDFLAAFGSEVALAPSTGDVKPTAFHMTAGQQAFLKSARDLAASLDPQRSITRREARDAVKREVVEAFDRALFGPWLYKDRFHSLGWDPATEALYALLASAPGGEKPFSERAAVWLAFESLPLFPTAARGNRLLTRGFDGRPEYLSWPIWTAPISLSTLRSLLGFRELNAVRPTIGELSQRGIVAVYRSLCQRDANGRGTLRNAVLCAGDFTNMATFFVPD